MSLFYAERVRCPGYRICDASAFVWPPIASTAPGAWMNAAKEDWDLLDMTVNGRLYARYFLVACHPDAVMTKEPSEVVQ